MYKFFLLAGALALITTPVVADGGSKKRVVRVYEPRQVIRVYEPRPAPPLAAVGLLGTNLIIWDDLDVDLYDDTDPIPPRVRRLRNYEYYRATRLRRY